MSKVIEMKTRRKSDGYVVRILICNSIHSKPIQLMFKELKKHYYFRRITKEYSGFIRMNYTSIPKEKIINIVYVGDCYDPENIERFNTRYLEYILDIHIEDMFKSKVDHQGTPSLVYSVLDKEPIELDNNDVKSLSSIENYNVRFIDLYDLMKEL